MLALILLITVASLRGKLKEPRSSICFQGRRVARPDLFCWLMPRVMYSSLGAKSLDDFGLVPYVVILFFSFVIWERYYFCYKSVMCLWYVKRKALQLRGFIEFCISIKIKNKN